MKTHVLKIPAGQFVDLHVSGDYVRVKKSAVELTIENVASQGRDKVDVMQGDDFNFEPFDSLRIMHYGAGEQEVRLIVSKGKKAGSNPVSSSVSVASLTGGHFIQSSAQASNAVILLSGSKERKYLFIQNNDESSVLRLKLNGAEPAANSGIRLFPGDSLELSGAVTSSDVRGIFETATAQVNNVELLEF